MIDTAVVVSLVLGSIGTTSGCYATWLSHRATRQDLTIVCTDPVKMQFRVINGTLRPIPIQAAIMDYVFDDSKQVHTLELSLQGISVPGVLAPESSFDIRCDLDHYIGIVLSSRYWLRISTQTGVRFTLSGKYEQRN